MMNERQQRVSAQALDVIFKLEAEGLARLLPDRFGLPIAPIAGYFPTELPQLDLHLERLDSVFQLEDGSLLHLEFQRHMRTMDMVRFVGYGMALFREYVLRVRTVVVICGPAMPSLPPPIDGGQIPYRLDCVQMAGQDGEVTLARLRDLAARGGPWRESDLLDLKLLPLLAYQRPIEDVVVEGLALAQELAQGEQRRVIATLLALAYHYLGEPMVNQLIEELRTMNLLESVLAESWEEGEAKGLAAGLARGLMEGRAEGRAEGERRAVLRVLARRFGPVPERIGERLAEITELPRLEELLDAAVTIESLEAFAALLGD